MAFNNTTSNAKKPKNCENSVNDEKLIYAEKSTAKKNSNKVDKSASLKQLKDAEGQTHEYVEELSRDHRSTFKHAKKRLTKLGRS